MQTRLIGGTSYFTRAQLEASNPSRREGIDAVAEARWRSTTSKLVKAAIKTLKLPDWVYETSMNYINRFFLTRSISKNDRHLVVGGAILLASKVQESPRSVQDVAYVLLQLKNANKKAQHGPDQTTLEQFMEGVVLAEQAILFSLNFNLNVETHVSLARRLLEPLDLWAKTNPPLEEVELNQLKLGLYAAVMFFLNDSALTNLSLQFPNSKVAPVALLMAAKRITAARYNGKEVPAALQRVLSLANDAEWFASKGLTLETAADIEAQINELYATSPAQPAAAAQQQRQQQSQAPPSSAAGPQPAQASSVPRPQADQQRPRQDAPPRAGASVGPQQQPAEASNAAFGGRRDGEAPPTTAAAYPTSQRPGSPPQTATLEVASVAGGLTPQCGGQQGQPSSSAAAPPTLGTTAEGTPELPHPPSPQHHPVQDTQAVGQEEELQQRGTRKRISDGDECAAGEQQATSELQPAPEQQPDAEAQARNMQHACAAPACDGGNDVSADNCSPDGLTAGNASGSGGGFADGQPEVCSRPGIASCQGTLHSQPSEQHCAKRRRAAVELDDGVLAGEHAEEEDTVGPAAKARRLEASEPATLQP